MNSSMRYIYGSAPVALFLLTALVAGVMPLLGKSPSSGGRDRFPGWPAAHEGRPLTPLPLGEREAVFAREFPGRTGRFTDGRREIILRWVVEPTRRLHSAADCLHAVGYTITPLPSKRDADGRLMGCLRAKRADSDLSVCEVVRDEKGAAWPDVSAWYWSALLGFSSAPWWSIVVAETADAAG